MKEVKIIRIAYNVRIENTIENTIITQYSYHSKIATENKLIIPY
jgi:hypothetical protein